jgi:hypothetical protein
VPSTSTGPGIDTIGPLTTMDDTNEATTRLSRNPSLGLSLDMQFHFFLSACCAAANDVVVLQQIHRRASCRPAERLANFPSVCCVAPSGAMKADSIVAVAREGETRSD